MKHPGALAHILCCLLWALWSPGAIAFDCTESSGWLGHKCARIAEAMKSGDRDILVPIYARHGRDTYARDRIDGFNEDPLGIGFGRSIIDRQSESRGDWHSIYVMAFRDSHYRPQSVLGYGYQVFLGSGEFKLGLGYTAFLTSRSDIAGGFPVPAVLPMGSLRYGRASLMAAYVPRLSGNQGNGDVLFLFAHLEY